MNEVWKRVKEEGFENSHEVSNFGKVRSLDRISRSPSGYVRKVKRTVLKSNLNSAGYRILELNCNGYAKTVSVHRLLMMAFKPHPNQDLLHVNHIDSNRQNNHIDNLEWVTPKENIRHGVEFGFITTKSDKYNAVRVIVKDSHKNIVSIFGSSVEAVEYMGVSRTRLDSCLNSRGGMKIFNELTVKRSCLETEEIPLNLLNKPVSKRGLLSSRSKPVKISGNGFLSYYSGIRKSHKVNGSNVDFYKNLKLGKSRRIRGLYLIENITQWEYVNANEENLNIPLPKNDNGEII